MKKDNLSAVKLSEEQRKKLKEEIAAFYMDSWDEEIGLLKQEQLLDLFMENLAPFIYNKALDDVRVWHRAQADNMEADYYMLYKE